jgi:tRNA A37 N6-isopentenylltransferase MiaA
MNRVIAIFGPTSTGKTAMSLQLADHIEGVHGKACEIVSIDSRQLYRHMDIGTAKVSLEIRGKYIHHFIDILDPIDRYHTDQYIQDARTTIAKIFERGNIPILVGGSGTVMMGLIGTQHFLNAEPETLPHESLLLIPTFERIELYRRIEANINEMFHSGLYREVKQIISHTGLIPWQLKVTTSYREFVEYAANHHRNIMTLDRPDLEKIKQQVKVHTKKYAMHQAGWLKKLTNYHPIDSLTIAKKVTGEFMRE